MNKKKGNSSEEYGALLKQTGRHTYSQKRKAAHLSRICTIENLLPLCQAKTGFSDVCQKAETIILSERRKYGSG